MSFDSADTIIVVSGSLAREEFTSGSDIDWTLPVDGSADPQHYDLTAKINKVVENIAGKPTGAEGTFSFNATDTLRIVFVRRDGAVFKFMENSAEGHWFGG